ncbi:hypothetical protein OS493_010001 [Desmophyllum pertusum]|uniref:Uncharacterized protein n=1 Tax=Desmophyllum pertusum TaxID=174260 RepID=A0A9X0CHS7_9CNID|nr:hypothetical protein OS493_010001 [Desmophyllum pertusum]
MNLKLELNKSDHSDLVHIFRCEGATERDVNTTVLASQVIASISSALFYLAIFSLSILGVCFKSCVKVSSSQGTFFVFLVGALIAFVNVFTNANDLQIKLYCRIFTVFLIGIVFTLFGALLFFKRPGNQLTLGRTQPSMGLVVALITFPLIGIEIALLMAARTASNSEKADEPAGPFTYQPWTFVMADKCLFLAQKIIQALIYLYLRNKIICQEYKENAQFYFRTLSFFNLIEWVDTQVNVDNDIRLSGLADQRIVIDLYKPLIIDYRLLCSLLFLEHSVDIQTEDNQVEVEVEIEANNGVAGNTEGPYNNMTPCDRQMRCIGYVAGCVWLIAPLFCGLYYVNEFHLKPWVNAFAIVVNLAIVACGTCLLWSNDLDEGGNKESHGVKIMVVVWVR